MSESNYNKSFKSYARELRNNSTDGEIILWKEALRARKMYGYQFNRQYPIAEFIVDFICRRLKLIIEVDGYSHQFKVDKDKQRDAILNSLGYQILRIDEFDVKRNLNNVIRCIEAKVEELEQELG
ncbi:endonuclease domain-containing protein [Carboxylicivirga sediminis]|uniref:Endonuclease domain-containing protein n=1 Tax=Carboxylicivirga sediminis TaxID=2006564 RepID=A0A941F6D7_9BACT|nr:DUF559 domain-containing protein [Carboxylicivirga sediminis]MBR8536798.1 endonuclease domain-containing protein [Carboxylicivirga sediminis]